ncbi:MAG: RsmD family RNA methyltransferase [Bacteroidales bacterium]|nr:RsmD family RNA methyltransferase [Bacteroidales bacterium]
MRIIRGSHRGRRITAPASLPVRPTTDLAKESLFNILENYIYFEDTRVLDLYAGTGNISYEFASRGAPLVVAVDINPRCVRFIGETAGKLGFGQLKAVRSSSLGYLRQSSGKFDLIFADPPYDLDGITEIPVTVFDRQVLTPDGWLIIEHAQQLDFSEFQYFHEKRRYGKVNFSFFRFVSE